MNELKPLSFIRSEHDTVLTFFVRMLKHIEAKAVNVSEKYAHRNIKSYVYLENFQIYLIFRLTSRLFHVCFLTTVSPLIMLKFGMHVIQFKLKLQSF